MIKKSVLLILPASDFNEHEFLIIKSLLEKDRLTLFIASDSNFLCIGSNGLKIKNDIQLYNIHENNFAGIIFIGGDGVKKYWDNRTIHSIIKKFYEKKKLIGAICNAAVIIARAGLRTECATCFPENKIEIEKAGIKFKDEPVIVSNNIITGRDPQAASDFAKTFIYEIAKRS